MDPVDALLQNARQLLGTTTPAEPTPGTYGTSNLADAHPASWEGDTSTTAKATSTTLDAQRDQLRTSHAGAARTIAAASTLSTQARTQLDAVQTAWQQDKTALAPHLGTGDGKAALIQAAQQRVTETTQIVKDTATNFQQLARQLPAAGDLPASGDHDGAHATMVDNRTSTNPEPAHGKDPRYWIDVTKIIHVPDGQYAPSGTTQIGPNMYYPSPDTPGFATPPPPAAKYPLDFNDIQRTAPGQLPDYNHTTQAPGWAYPRPNPFQPDPPWTPHRPIDIRDIVQVPPGSKAPWGYSEYAPGWFAPDPTAFDEH